MNIYNDKALYKLAFGVFAVFFIMALSLSAVAGGVKAFLFMLWVIFVLVIFCGVVGGTLNSGLSTSSKVPWKRAASGCLDYYLYYAGLCVFVCFLFFTSSLVWVHLERTFPSLEAQVKSTIPISVIIPGEMVGK